MQTWAEFDRLETEHYNAMFDEYNRDYDYEYEEEETEKEYAVTYSYKGSEYEWDFYINAEDAEDAEEEFWCAVLRKEITDGIPENMDDIEILDIWEVA